jgi:hypothetical protein
MPEKVPIILIVISFEEIFKVFGDCRSNQNNLVLIFRDFIYRWTVKQHFFHLPPVLSFLKINLNLPNAINQTELDFALFFDSQLVIDLILKLN